MENKKELVQSSLLDLLKIHSIETMDLMIDEIVLNYIIGIIEDLDAEGSTDEAEVEQFLEMMEAYIPGFDKIKSPEVIKWMFQLSHDMSDQKSCNSKNIVSDGCISDSPCLSIPITNPIQGSKQNQKPASRKIDQYTSSSSSPNEEDPVLDEKVRKLLEMFPASCQLEAFHCLSLAGGDMDEATQLILDRQESGESIVPSAEKRLLHFQAPVQDDKKVRDQMLQKYAYIDEEEDKKVYRPTAPKSVPKKLVRYLDNKVVSTKGERFTLFNKDDEDSLKKTYINLKPSKKYRFH